MSRSCYFIEERTTRSGTKKLKHPLTSWSKVVKKAWDSRSATSEFSIICGNRKVSLMYCDGGSCFPDIEG